jgi:lipopolysaccharide biosynthesis regulator YciM
VQSFAPRMLCEIGECTWQSAVQVGRPGATISQDQPSCEAAAFKVELAQQEHGARLDTALQRAIRPIPKHVNGGWLPASDTHNEPRKRL